MQPGDRAEHLDLDLLRPVRLARCEKPFAQLLELVDVGLRGGGIAAARRAQGAGEMRDGFGGRERRAERLQLRRALPVLALERVARRNRGARGIAGRHRPEDLADLCVLADQLARLRVLAELQVGVLHEVVGMRHADQHAVELGFRRVLARHGDRPQVRGDRLLPHADHRINVRRHVLRVRRRRRDLRVLVRHRHALARERREIVAVDEVMRDAGMLRILLVERLEDADRLQQRRHVLVVEGLVERERVEHLRLDVVRVLLRQRRHRLLVVPGARVLVDLVEVPVELLDRRQPVALALGLGADRLALLHRIEAALERRGVPRADERVGARRHGEPPVGDRAARIGLGNGGERLQRFGKIERMQLRERPLELLLRLRAARSPEQHFAEAFLLGLRVVVSEHAEARESE